MKILLTVLAWLGLTTATFAQGYLNPPVYATGTIFAVTGVTGSTTTPIKNAYAPNNLNIYNRAAINVWTIIMPFPAFDGEIINVGCPGGDITTFDITTVSGSGDAIGAGGPTSCTASNHPLYMYQFQLEINTWKFITATGGAGGSECADCILVESGASSKISAFSLTPQPLGPYGLVTGIWTDPDTGIPANFNFDQTKVLGGQNAGTGSDQSGTSVTGTAGAADGNNSGGNYTFIGGASAGALSTGSTGGQFAGLGGTATNGATGGPVALIGGNAIDGNGGSATIAAGDSTEGTTGVGGAVSISSGAGLVSGSIAIATPVNFFSTFESADPASGSIVVSTGGIVTLPGSSGALQLLTGSAGGDNASSGTVTIQTGDVAVTEGGTLATVGSINIHAGLSVGSSDGPVFGGGTAGTINILAGDGGALNNPNDGRGTGGNVNITSGFGVGTGHHSGNIIITIGEGNSSATNGNIIIHNIPTSASGLPSGAIYADSVTHILTYVP